jgi:hypothetical protein
MPSAKSYLLSALAAQQIVAPYVETERSLLYVYHRDRVRGLAWREHRSLRQLHKRVLRNERAKARRAGR